MKLDLEQDLVVKTIQALDMQSSCRRVFGRRLGSVGTIRYDSGDRSPSLMWAGGGVRPHVTGKCMPFKNVVNI